jgi:hypothetical protein
MRTFRWILVSALGLLVVSAIGFIIWGSTPLGPLPEGQAALVSDAQVQVSQAQWLIFQPVGKQPATGFIFYPGGRVDYRSYAPLAQAVARQGYLVVIVPMPLNLAVLGSDRAAQVQVAFPQIKHWVIGGHSLGGAMAAHYTAQHPDRIQGVIFYAAYPATSDSLANFKIGVLSIYGSQDGLVTSAKIDASRPFLPAGTQFLAIEGGNHAQFGYYGLQPGDGSATISRQQQQAEAVQATVEFLAKVGGF